MPQYLLKMDFVLSMCLEQEKEGTVMIKSIQKYKLQECNNDQIKGRKIVG